MYKVKRKKLVFAFLVSAALLAAGCRDSRNGKSGKTGTPVSLKVFGVSGMVVQDGTAVGVTAGYPIEAYNLECKVAGKGLLTSERDFNWGYDQSSNSVFLAYSPYNAGYTEDQQPAVFKMETDQSTEKGFAAANLMVGMTSGNPQTRSLSINMKHVMCAMQVNFDNRTDDEIAGVTVAGLIVDGKLDLLTGSLTASGVTGLITPMKSPAGDDTYCFLFIPQSSTPRYSITMKSGKKYTFTYSTPISPYPGKVMHKSDIIISDDTPEANILDDYTAGLSAWNTDGMPDFPQSGPRVDLLHMKDITTDEDGYFSAYLKPVTVTHTERIGDGPMGVILEDESMARFIWLYPGTEVEVGCRVSGFVQGYMSSTPDGELTVSYLYLEDASVSEPNATLPLQEGTFGSVNDRIDSLSYRRMLFRDVTLTQAFEGDRAQFSQGGVTLPVICPAGGPAMSVGTSGDLTGFPAYVGNTPSIMVYDPESFSTVNRADSAGAFGSIAVTGVYDLSNPELPAALISDSGSIQTSFRTSPDYVSMQWADFDAGRAVIVANYEYDYQPGHIYETYLGTNGDVELPHGSFLTTCVKLSGGMVWLVDETSRLGFIIPSGL